MVVVAVVERVEPSWLWRIDDDEPRTGGGPPVDQFPNCLISTRTLSYGKALIIIVASVGMRTKVLSVT